MGGQTQTSSSQHRRANWLTGAAVAVWAMVVCFGWVWMQQYGFTVQDPLTHSYVENWPQDTDLQRDAGKSTLLVFIHPRCPCTRASLSELERAVAGLAGEPGATPQTIVVSTVPGDADSAWLDSDTVARAARLPNAKTFVDRDGHEAELFGATTSGTVMLFDADGKRVFAGGITASRGHEGGNVGRDMLSIALHGEPVTDRETPTFGCRLCLPDETENNATNLITANSSAN